MVLLELRQVEIIRSRIPEMMTELSETEIRKSVKERYAGLAGSGESCCSTTDTTYSNIPLEASSISDGSGHPLELLNLKEGDAVVDFGSGGGADAFQASKLVGLTGRVIGVDSTPEMIWRARDTARKYGYTNVEFRLGEIEHVPVESESVDYVISNCVINLAPDKGVVLKEVFRVLKHGGKIAVSDIVVEEGAQVKAEADTWCACETGAITLSKYLELLVSSGFAQTETKPSQKDGHSGSHRDVYLTATKR